MTNINNDKIVEEVVLVLDNKVLNSDDNDVNDNSESIVGVKNSEETDKLDENKDDQMTDNEVSRGENYENIIKNSADEILVEVGCNNGMLVCVDGLKSCLLYTSCQQIFLP